MAPQPWNCSGRFSILYSAAGLPHKARFPVDVALVGGIPKLKSSVTSDFTVDPAAFGATIWNLAKPFYDVLTASVGWLIEEKSGISFVPLASGTIAVSGTAGAPAVPASELAMTFRSATRIRFNSYWQDTSYVPPYKDTVDPPTGAIVNYMNSVIALVTAGAIGECVRTKTDEEITRKLHATIALNHRVRRAHHLA